MASSSSSDALSELKKLSTVVADTGEFALVEHYRPQDSTTNPSLILGAMSKPEYGSLIDQAIDYVRTKGTSLTAEERLSLAADKLCVNFGVELLARIPGRVSSEVDARLSFNTQATVERALRIVSLYEEVGVNPRERVLIKIASTWEGLQAAKILEERGIRCNMTLIFAPIQARVAGEVGACLISPFVGRITDYWKAKRGVSGFAPDEDPGVLCVRTIAKEMHENFGDQVEVMGASFRNTDQILALAGCPFLTISPDLLQQLEAMKDHPVERKIQPATKIAGSRPLVTQSQFLFDLNADECASFKLAEGIRRFVQDQEVMESKLAALLNASS